VRRALLAAVLGALLAFGPQAAAQEAACDAVVVVIEEATLPDLLEVPALRSLAAAGGAALMNGRSDALDELSEMFPPDVPQASDSPCSISAVGPIQAGRTAIQWASESTAPLLVMVISASPSAASAADGDELGAVIAAWGDPDELLEAEGEPKALTSDSTRRAGVVATVDPAATVAGWLDLPYDAGAPIEATDEPAPLDLYERYLQYRRLAVPTAGASWILMGAAAVGSIAILRARDRASDRALAVVGALAAAFPWLPLVLLLAGHLPSLTMWTVVPFVAVTVAAGAAFTTWVARRWGALRAMAATGALILVILLLEAVTGWGAAVTPLVGGGQLDGGRFFGMPNAMIGLVLGAALYAAHRLAPGWGAALLAACALVAGSPWTGADYGASITLSAAVGLWVGVRGGRPWWVTGLLTVATTAIGAGVVSVMHRFLTERPTHVTSFLEETTGPRGALERLFDRLGIGVQLIADSPFAIVPVVGTIVLLILVLRPPATLAATFAASDAWHDALLVLLIGSIVAYLSNDTGAAALGFGFVLALAGLLHVSAAAARGKMGR
jgi:hypothetical protein